MQPVKENQKELILRRLHEKLRAGQSVERQLNAMKKMPTVEVAEILSALERSEMLELLQRFSPMERGLIVSDFSPELQRCLFENMNRMPFAEIFEYMNSDIRVDFYQRLDKEEQVQLLPFLNKKTREEVIHLSSYPPETAGGIMTTDFATVLEWMTVAEAIDKVRYDAPSKKMIYYVYVVDEQMKMIGFLTLRDLIMAAPQTPIRDILYTDFVYADVEEDRENVAKKIEKYDLVAIPVLNTLGQLVGIVSHDEAIEVIRAEHTEDLEKFMGIVHATHELNYTKTSIFRHFQKRIVWLVSLGMLSLLSGMVIHRFESVLEQLLILALYMPMLTATGGNAGSQAGTVIVRALALGQISSHRWIRILLKEWGIALLLATCMGLLYFGNVHLLSSGVHLPDNLQLSYIALVIALAFALQVMTATLIGAGLPLLVKRLSGDPAIAASPAITTIVDITGLLLYFGIATLMLGF